MVPDGGLGDQRLLLAQGSADFEWHPNSRCLSDAPCAFLARAIEGGSVAEHPWHDAHAFRTEFNLANHATTQGSGHRIEGVVAVTGKVPAAHGRVPLVRSAQDPNSVAE